MAKLQTGHEVGGVDGNCGEVRYTALITADTAPKVLAVYEGSDFISFTIEGGEIVEAKYRPPWVLNYGETVEEAWCDYWVENPSEAPAEYSILKKRLDELTQEKWKVESQIEYLANNQ